ncbi:uncharacterized protein KIAA1522 homolog isoform X2 [Megalops cyprinoides]|uniref:uncharacterized protein KIAA1522 homolog isoform X2 n=1 Tax=Megalops cyprinoides TaxID=118141 RepID=UPI0018655D0E|nr:uncharacterized protein KIAA1522 homolog isoform X2 [Megalops cyprinoides]
MSGRNSAGDLVPRDITEILARECKANKGKKKQGGSFGRAFSWLKGSKKKSSSSSSNGQSRGGRAGESRASKQGHQEHDSAKAAPKQEDERKLTVHYKASQHYQENVFIEGSRPQYLEDLHTEAQEGLKILQQEENKNGTDYQGNQSVSSIVTRLQPEEDASARQRKGSLDSRGTATETLSTASTMSTQSALTRQGSTFKPLTPVKRLDKTRKRNRRTTIMGIPHHVQKELGLERGTLIQQNAEGKLLNGCEGPPGIIVIPTIDGEVPAGHPEGARVHLQDLEALQSSKEEELLKRHIRAVYRDDLALNHKAGARLSPMPRPKSLAVPGMTTSSFLQEPQGPVMSVSPQATYLSKIIPNAVLPAAVEVIEISRDRSRSSVRTVSKGGLPAASPASSRSAGPQGLGSSSWSHSQSSETIISNSSTVSSKGSGSTPRIPSGGEEAARDLLLPQQAAADEVSIGSTVSWVSSGSTGAKAKAEPGAAGSREADDVENPQGDRGFVRSLSVMKTKLPPAPPRRTYSLAHEKLKQRSQELADIKYITDPSGVNGSVPCGKNGDFTYTADSAESGSSTATSPLNTDQAATREGAQMEQQLPTDSSPQKLPSPGNRFERTMSPSSGYSSQSGTPTLSAKEICPPSPGKKKVQPVKPERASSRASPAASISSSLTSLSSSMSDPTHQETPDNNPPAQPLKAPPPVAIASTKVAPAPPIVTLREAFDIPPPPKVKAPSPPPPETWIHNKRTFELLCGPNTFASRYALLQKQQQQQKQSLQMQKPEAPRAQIDETGPGREQPQEEDKATVLPGKEKSTLQSMEEPAPAQTPDRSSESAGGSPGIKDDRSVVQMKEEGSPKIQKKEEVSPVVQRQEEEGPRVEKKEPESSVVLKKEPPPVMKKSSPMARKKEPENVQESLLLGSKETAIEVRIHAPPQEEMSQSTPDDTGKSLTAETTTPPQSSMETLSVGAPKVAGVSPPPSPPPAHHPPPPPSKKTPSTSESSPPSDTCQEIIATDSCWPPPPPPMEDSSLSAFEGQDEMDFPPPPPPILQELQLDMLESSTVSAEVDKTSAASEAPVKHEEPTPGAGEMAPDVSVPVAADVTPIIPAELKSTNTETSACIAPCPAPAQSDIHESQVSQIPPPSKEAHPLQEEILPPQEVPPQLEEAPPTSEEAPPINDEAPPTLQEAPPLQEEVPPISQESPPLIEEVPPTSQEALAVQEYIPPPPQEAPPPPPVAPGVIPSAPPMNVTSDLSKTITPVPSVNVPLAPPLPTENQAPVNFRRQSSLASRESKTKDQLSRSKSTPVHKEDANIPLVTPSLLQMVRLRSVNVGDDQPKALSEDGQPGEVNTPSQDQTPSQESSQSVPQKPVRKSLSVKSPTATVASPSMRLQEAIRMKTAAMSSRDGLPSRLSLRSSVSTATSGDTGLRSPRLQEGGDLPKSPASTASFIFSKSTKKVVIETPSSSEAQSHLKRSLVAELMQVSDPTKSAAANGRPGVQAKKPGKVPPPVAKKPAHGPNLSDKPVIPTENTGTSQSELNSSSPTPLATEANGETEAVQPAGQQALLKESQDTASGQETANTASDS